MLADCVWLTEAGLGERDVLSCYPNLALPNLWAENYGIRKQFCVQVWLVDWFISNLEPLTVQVWKKQQSIKAGLAQSGPMLPQNAALIIWMVLLTFDYWQIYTNP